MNYGPMDPGTVFLYLGYTVSYKNRDWAALYHNIRKSRRRRVMAEKVTMKEGSSVRANKMMYKEVVQKVLMYGRESWAVMGAVLTII